MFNHHENENHPDGLPSVAELWRKLNDHSATENTQPTVPASEFFTTDGKRLLAKLQATFDHTDD